MRRIGVEFMALLIFCLFIPMGNAEVVQMKIVDDISSYGYSNFGPDSSNSNLVPKVKPANFSGPTHLKVLKGKCFTLRLSEYKYKFCPFDNVTQHEQTYRWNPYSGILGVWKEWEIKNNTFHSMIMPNGDSCGSDSRQVQVVLSCGRANNLTEVSEPKTCNYLLKFETPLVCHEDSLLVYPRINSTLQQEWDRLEQQLYDEEITAKGYNIYLRRILWKAGLVSSHSTSSDQNVFKPFQSLDNCNSEYQKLLEEIKKLRSEKQQR
uniref:N-acetylglucosamine-1-phosphotransferase subunit gamma-like n=1 Tax=Styela clava TaxID=7725 RepID=UPI00193A17F0|nr:N-acetylglucosamine-1-phosphotransferase subunit gamma-like [Styela clava]